jgi:hypothetical protein
MDAPVIISLAWPTAKLGKPLRDIVLVGELYTPRMELLKGVTDTQDVRRRQPSSRVALIYKIYVSDTTEIRIGVVNHGKLPKFHHHAPTLASRLLPMLSRRQMFAAADAITLSLDHARAVRLHGEYRHVGISLGAYTHSANKYFNWSEPSRHAFAVKIPFPPTRRFGAKEGDWVVLQGYIRFDSKGGIQSLDFEIQHPSCPKYAGGSLEGLKRAFLCVSRCNAAEI